MTTTPARQALEWVLGITAVPAEQEVVRRFTPRFLEKVPAGQLCVLLQQLVEDVRDDVADMTVRDVDSHRLVARLGDTEVLVGVERTDEQLMGTLLFREVEVVVKDPRLVDPPCTTTGPLPLADLALTEWGKGLVGLSVHVRDDDTSSTAVVGWADLAAGRALTADDVFPAYSITKLLTTVAVLQLVATGQIDIERPAAEFLTTLSLPGDITVRHLLTHHGAVASYFDHWADSVPELIDLLGRDVAVNGRPGEHYVYSNGGFAVLGQLVADVAGRPYVDVITEQILRPLGMAASFFPSAIPQGAVVLHDVQDEVIHAPDQKVSTIPAAGGMWTTAADLATFGLGWMSLLPPELAEAAISPQAKRSDTSWIGYGFLLGERSGRRVVGHTGGGIGASTSLLLAPDDHVTAVTLSNRPADAEPISFLALQAAFEARTQLLG